MSWHTVLQVFLFTWAAQPKCLLAAQALQPTNEAGHGGNHNEPHGHDEPHGDVGEQIQHIDEEEPRVVAGTMGMSRPMYAFVLGTGSGLSLIIGAIVGCKLSPVSDLSCSAMMAFGAGALLFAVTIELYAHALHELRHGSIAFWSEMCVILGFALVGACFYLYVNRYLEQYMLGEDMDETGSPGAEIEAARHVNDVKPTEPKAKKAANPFKKPAANTPLMQSGGGAGFGAAPSGDSSSSGGAPAGETPEEKKKRLSLKAKAMWAKARTSVKFSSFVKIQAMRNVRGREKGLRHLMVEIKRMASNIGLDSPRTFGKTETQVEFQLAERDEVVNRAKLVALQLFLGLLVDGVPEAVLMGFLAARGHLTPVFIIALFFANFPEAFSSASLLTTARLNWWGIIGMWTFLCLLVGTVAGISCWALLAMYPGYATGAPLPTHVLVGIASIEGLTGGSMIACIAAVMLPEAFERMGKEPPLLLSSGFMCALGFLAAVLLKAVTD